MCENACSWRCMHHLLVPGETLTLRYKKQQIITPHASLQPFHRFCFPRYSSFPRRRSIVHPAAFLFLQGYSLHIQNSDLLSRSSILPLPCVSAHSICASLLGQLLCPQEEHLLLPVPLLSCGVCLSVLSGFSNSVPAGYKAGCLLVLILCLQDT